MRRWLSYHRAGRTVDERWHTMLVSLLAEFAMSGDNPWEVAATVLPPMGADDDSSAKTFKFKHQALRILLNPMNQRVLRSSLVCFDSLAGHHARYDHTTWTDL